MMHHAPETLSVVAGKHFRSMVTPESNSLKENSEREEFVRATLKALYEKSPSDDAFQAYARTFLMLAHIDGGGEVTDRFCIEVSDRRDSMTLYRDGGTLEVYCEFTFSPALYRPRSSWHTYFMEAAYRAADRSTCMSGRRVGAVFTRNNVQVMSAHNGVPRNFPHPKSCARIDAGCKSGERLDMCPCLHAETNGINLAAAEGISLRGTTLYCLARPCSTCMGNLVGAGVERIIYAGGYPHDISDDIARYGGVELLHIADVIHSDSPI